VRSMSRTKLNLLSGQNDSSDFVNLDGLGFKEINLLSIEQIQKIGDLSLKEAAKILSRAKEEERKERAALRDEAAKRKEELRKTFTVIFDNRFRIFTVGDDSILQKIVDRNGWIGLKEIQPNQSPETIITFDQIKNNSIYAPDNIKISDLEQLQKQISGLVKSKAEFTARMHFKEYFHLHSIDDVEYVGSDIQLLSLDGSATLGDVDSLFKINNLNLYILLERKTTVGVDTAVELLDQIQRTRVAFQQMLTGSQFLRDKYHLVAEGFAIQSALYFVAGDPAVEATLLKEGILIIKDVTSLTF